MKTFEDIKEELTTKVFESLGSASMCWSDIRKAGVFCSEEAKEIGEKLMKDIKELMSDG